MKYIYVAGPYSRGDPVVNTRNAILVGDELVKLGYAPYIPHVSLLWHIVSPHEIDYWYNLDLAWLVRCDGLLRLPGDSSGADNEVKVAQANQIPVFYSLEELGGPK